MLTTSLTLGEHEERQASVGTIPRRLNAGMDMARTRRDELLAVVGLYRALGGGCIQ